MSDGSTPGRAANHRAARPESMRIEGKEVSEDPMLAFLSESMCLARELIALDPPGDSLQVLVARARLMVARLEAYEPGNAEG